ncbi:hypothetical protein DFH08DRAFT_809091 [Mycena albidolilacea]|uniref:Uncharacterized protein n=1 Tax=Mycena albidolilacea TaxID=1033008 RepID=A0AAD7EQI4_9AGAR|nr:hypothetical protein DFH08DRAFT_809091 [Mycena albidolilacea]
MQLLCKLSDTSKVPHTFQQRFLADKTPTFRDALPAFEAMISQWEKQQAQYLETAHTVQQGINKLESYLERVEDVPAYILSMLINPAIKLNWFERFRPDRVGLVKDLFLCEATEPTPGTPLHDLHGPIGPTKFFGWIHWATRHVTRVWRRGIYNDPVPGHITRASTSGWNFHMLDQMDVPDGWTKSRMDSWMHGQTVRLVTSAGHPQVTTG